MIPTLALIGGGVSNHQVIQEHFQKIFDISQTTAVQIELDDIAKMIYLDSIDGSAPKNQEEFVTYVRKNMKTKVGQTRDTSLDNWGTTYRYEILPSEFRVSSAGPDKAYNTSDDIVTGYKY